MCIENILKFVVPSIMLGACATGRASTRPNEPSEVGAVEVSPAGEAIPVVTKPRLPTADQHSAEIRQQAGAVASARVSFCVAPDGHVEGVNLLQGSPSSAYNQAVVKDVYTWEFGGEGFNPSSLTTCEVATINYRPAVDIGQR